MTRVYRPGGPASGDGDRPVLALSAAGRARRLAAPACCARGPRVAGACCAWT